MKTLVAGWFSYEQGHATAGDLLARDVVCAWLDRAGCPYDIALAAPFRGGVNWRQVDPADYSHALFVCGPFQRSELELEFLQKFNRCRLIGLNLSMREPLSQWNPFDLLVERDSSEGEHADMAFVSPRADVPVVGVCLVEPYPDGRTESANVAIHRLIESQEMAVVDISTRLDVASGNPLRSPAAIESLIARVDVLLTTRLHGLVLALKNGVPVIAIDPKPGGAKIDRQAQLLDWPARFVVDQLDHGALQETFRYCLTEAARTRARQCGQRAQRMALQAGEDFVAELLGGNSLENRYQARMADEQPDSACPAATVAARKPIASPASWWDMLKKRWQQARRRMGRP